MPEITIKITVPDGAEVVVTGVDEDSGQARLGSSDPEAVERYFGHFLSDNGRKLYQAAARLEEYREPGYTLGDIAASLSIDYPSAQSYHRTSGRSARHWQDETGTEAPIQLESLSYEWVKEEDGMRNRYQLPPGVAAIEPALAAPAPPPVTHRPWRAVSARTRCRPALGPRGPGARPAPGRSWRLERADA